MLQACCPCSPISRFSSVCGTSRQARSSSTLGTPGLIVRRMSTSENVLRTILAIISRHHAMASTTVIPCSVDSHRSGIATTGESRHAEVGRRRKSMRSKSGGILGRSRSDSCLGERAPFHPSSSPCIKQPTMLVLNLCMCSQSVFVPGAQCSLTSSHREFRCPDSGSITCYALP